MTYDQDKKEWKIKANQGHTVEIVGLDLHEILSPQEIPVVVHGTDLQGWALISKTGLCRMKRTHIHFAIGKYGDANVVSGMRGSANVMVYINVPLAMEDGIKFFRSPNGVILSAGINGWVALKYVDRVERKNGSPLPFDPATPLPEAANPQPAALSSSLPSGSQGQGTTSHPKGGKGKGKDEAAPQNLVTGAASGHQPKGKGKAKADTQPSEGNVLNFEA